MDKFNTKWVTRRFPFATFNRHYSSQHMMVVFQLKTCFCSLYQQWRRWLGRGPMESHVTRFVDESIMASRVRFPGRWRVRVCNIDWRSRNESKPVVLFRSTKIHYVDRGGAQSNTVAQKVKHRQCKREFRREWWSSGSVNQLFDLLTHPFVCPTQPPGSTSDILFYGCEKLALWSMKCL